MAWNKHLSQLEIFFRFAYCNPFSPEYMTIERELLGRFFSPSPAERRSRIFHLAHCLLKELRDIAANTDHMSSRAVELYENLALLFLFNRYQHEFNNFTNFVVSKKRSPKALFFDDFLEECEHYLGAFSHRLLRPFKPVHWFALSFQVCRALHEISTNIVGTCDQAGILRSAVWQSIFTHDLKRHISSSYLFMSNIPTLVFGPPGCGKAEIAKVISHSRYISFDPDTQAFTEHFKSGQSTINLAPFLEPTGQHQAFLHGGNHDRARLFENCKYASTLYVNEIGGADSWTQGKLRQILGSRTFQRVNDTVLKNFPSKMLASSSLELEKEVQSNRFRRDLFCLLHADVIKVPTLKTLLENAPGDLQFFVAVITERLMGAELAPQLTEQVLAAITKGVGAFYEWPGNYRELEQCVRHVIIHNAYSPYTEPLPIGKQPLAIYKANASTDDILSHHCTLLYSQTGSYEQTALIAKLDLSTVKAKIDHQLLAELRSPD